MGNTLSVWKFDSVDGARDAERRILELQKQELVTVHDAVTVSWAPGADSPTTKQLHNLTGSGALGGAFWGLAIGMIFLLPLVGTAIGAATGGLKGSMEDLGIDDGFVGQVRRSVTTGTSALFLLTSDAMIDALADGFRDMRAELIQTNLDPEREATLRKVFRDERAGTSPNS
ncbi:DUF1269 domain-containing protein [Glaciihabitans sp. dw_435]|uniref:DUF1269 domain-containing protein n=1 Tax=Glaciihabitans sp. dw_435 TaxID=2720081 RepID=UPI00210454C6|nr:DUF1269 domain-containing protein [Glaciihabitans sp. dw_435]